MYLKMLIQMSNASHVNENVSQHYCILDDNIVDDRNLSVAVLNRLLAYRSQNCVPKAKIGIVLFVFGFSIPFLF